MKTLNKTLSLVLVLVMVLGMFGIASAKEFTDNADVKYVEAVDVMTGIGAINGYTDGSIKPTATITREEAAKLVAYSILGADVAKNLATATTGFTDVDAGRWSAPFISYLVGEGIINGMGDGTFAPTANVTGYQFAKMMLCAAGYGEKGEYTGASWQLNVAVDANKYGVYDDATGVDYTKAATREEAMLYAFNGITKVNQVTYNNVFGGYVAKNSITGLISASPTIATDLYGTKLDPDDAKDANGKYVIDGNGELTTGEDAYGNPADVWTFKNETIGSYAAEPTFSYVKDMSGATDSASVEKAMKGYTFNANAKVVTNYQAKTAATSVAQIIGLTGNGTEVNVYANGSEIVRVVVIRETLDKVAYVDSTKEEVTLDTLGLKTTKGYGKVAVGDAIVVARGKYVESPAALGSIAYVAKATTVKGVASTMSTRDKTITIDGKAYGIAAGCVAGYGLANFSVNTKGDAELILDENGFILKAIPYAASAANVIAITDTYSVMDGNKVVASVEGKNSVGDTVTYAQDGNLGACEAGDVVVVTTNASGKYVYTQITAAGTDGTNAYTISKAFTGSERNQTVGGGTYYYASNVKFIFAEDISGTDGKVTVMDGVQANKLGTAVLSTFILKDVGTTKEIVAVFVQDAPKSTANTSSDLVYLAAVDGTVVAANGNTYYNYLAVQNGALISNCYGFDANGKKFDEATSVAYPTGGFYTVSKNADGIYTFDAYTAGYPTTGSTASETSLNVMNGFVPYAFNDAKTAVSAFGANSAIAEGQGQARTVDISKATLINLDKKGISTGAEINASLTKMVNDLTDSSVRVVKVPTIGVIYNDKGVASIVYFAEKEYSKDVTLELAALTTLRGAFNGYFGYTIGAIV